MKKILVVCLGNICRSPMAEAVLRKKIEEKNWTGIVKVESRGTSGWEEGKRPHRGTRKKLKEMGIRYDDLYSQKIQAKDFDEFDLILGMDKQNVKDLKKIASKEGQEKVQLFLSVLPEHSYEEVPDPYYTGDFDLTYQLVEAGSEKWLETLK